jgi:hypothetical protein
LRHSIRQAAELPGTLAKNPTADISSTRPDFFADGKTYGKKHRCLVMNTEYNAVYGNL